jgi:hypothetical protein
LSSLCCLFFLEMCAPLLRLHGASGPASDLQQLLDSGTFNGNVGETLAGYTDRDTFCARTLGSRGLKCTRMRISGSLEILDRYDDGERRGVDRPCFVQHG